MSKHSIRSGRLSRLRHSRSSSSASIRRRRLLLGRRGVADASASWAFSLGELCEPPLLPALRRPHLDRARRAAREELGQRLGVADVGGDDDLRRDARRRRRSTRGRTPRGSSRRSCPPTFSRWNAYRSISLPVAEREHLHGGAIAFDGEPDHVDRPDRALVGGLPLGEAVDRRTGGCGSAPPPRSAPPPAASRIFSSSSRRIGRVSPERNSITPLDDRAGSPPWRS